MRAQAREVAGYVSHLNQLQFVFESSTMRYVLLSKMQTIHDHYNADIWIVSYDDGRLIYQFLDSGGNIVDPRYISSEAVLAQIADIYQGNEIRVQGLFPELGEDIVTIGVPWRYSDGHVVGAVLLNISTEDLRVRFMDVLPSLLPVGVGRAHPWRFLFAFAGAFADQTPQGDHRRRARFFQGPSRSPRAAHLRRRIAGAGRGDQPHGL